MKLSSNRQLYDYLVSLSAELKIRGADELSSVTASAAHHAWGMSTEFLGESRIALRRVLQEEGGGLSETDRIELVEVLKQLDDAFDKR
jgi:hypothetical protein